MQCPACRDRKLTETMTDRGVLVDTCDECGGVWLDRGEIFDLSDDPERVQRALDRATLSDEDHERPCPRCQTRLVGMSIFAGELDVDFCSECRGIWFDEGELERAAGLESVSVSFESDASAGVEVDWEAVEETERGSNDWETPESDAAAEPETSVHAPVGAAAQGTVASSALPNLVGRSAGVLFALYGILGAFLVALTELGYLSPSAALWLGVGFAVVQFAASPYLMDLSLGWVYSMHWAERRELPDHLDDFIVRVCREEGMNYPDIGMVHDGAPNAFTYGHTPQNARIVITYGLIDLLEPDELEAVVAHEIGHARNWDMAIMSIANLVPLLLYMLYRMLLRGDSDNNRGAIFGVIAFLLYIVSEYVVLYLSRTREYHADRYAGSVTGNPNALTAALIRIGYGLASGGDRSETDEDEALLGSDAFGAFGVFDPEAADSLAITSYDGDEVDEREGASGEAVARSDIDRKQVVDAMKWDLWNPWAKFYELNSTHPLVAERIQHLSDQSVAQGQSPFLRFDAEKPESYWDEFAVDVAVHVGPLAMGALAAGVGGYAAAAHGSWAPLGILLLLAGVSYLGRTLFSYPGGEFPDHSVASCLKHVKVSGVRGVPVTLKGTLIGRGVPGLIWSEDFVLQDETGILFVDYRQPLHIWEFLFGLLRNADYQNEPVEIRGWYRRSPVPYVELRELRTSDSTSTSYIYHVKIASGVLLTLVGAYLLFVL